MRLLFHVVVLLHLPWKKHRSLKQPRLLKSKLRRRKKSLHRLLLRHLLRPRRSRVVSRRRDPHRRSHLPRLHRLLLRLKGRPRFNPIVPGRGRSFRVHRVLAQSRLALRSSLLVRWHRPRLARPLVSPELVAMIAVSAVVEAVAAVVVVVAATIADAAIAKESAALSIRKQ